VDLFESDLDSGIVPAGGRFVERLTRELPERGVRLNIWHRPPKDQKIGRESRPAMNGASDRAVCGQFSRVAGDVPRGTVADVTLRDARYVLVSQ
jgi:hypothetical protein